MPNLNIEIRRFNPCFNGTMYKNIKKGDKLADAHIVSILVLMELCIKTLFQSFSKSVQDVSILVLMELCIKTEGSAICHTFHGVFQSLF